MESSRSSQQQDALRRRRRRRQEYEARVKSDMRESARQLTVFSTRHMRPLLTHDDLAQVMSKAGFFYTVNHPSPAESFSKDAKDSTFLGWREYVFSSKWVRVKSLVQPAPRVMLPYPRIDGLHIGVYADFIDAVEFYLREVNVADIIHIRSVGLDNRVGDGLRKWVRMRDESRNQDETVYREVAWPLTYYDQDPEGASKNWENNGSGSNNVGGFGRGIMSHRVPVYVGGLEDDIEVGRFVNYSDIFE